MASKTLPLSVVINTKNAATTLERTLKSVKWADQIIVMDMHSDDDTKKIARSFKADFFLHPDVGYVEPARNKAVSKAIHDWVLLVDADEEIPATLKNRLQHLLNGDATADAYYIPRKNIVFKEWYQHAGWWPDYQLRFFRKKAVVWSDKIHRVPKVKGKVDYLASQEKYAIIHHNYQSIEQFISRLNRYTSHEVAARSESSNYRLNTVTTDSVIDAFTNELVARLFRHHGIDGGLHGVSLSWMQAMYEMIVRLKQWQAVGFTTTKNDQQQSLAAIRKLQSDLSYWIADWNVAHTTGINKIMWMLRRKLKI
jgi:glycosyltransferase involved in cell wall biosynthesis